MNYNTVDDIPDRVPLEQYGKYVQINSELFVLCETFGSGKHKRDFRNEVLYTSESYRACTSFARELRSNGNRSRLTIHNVIKYASGNFQHEYVCEVDPMKATVPNMSKTHQKYLKDNHLGMYSENDNLTSSMYEKYLSTIKEEKRNKQNNF